MSPYISAYFAALVVFAAIDVSWLTFMANRFYRPILGDVLLPQVNLKAAAAFYALYPLGLVIFAVAPALKGGDLKSAAVMGALFGFFAYATYDLTNQATLKNWTAVLTVADVAWGSFVSGTAAFAAAWISSRLS